MQLFVVISVDIVHLVLDLVLENTRKIVREVLKSLKNWKIILKIFRKC